MKKKISLIIGSGILGAYLSAELIKKKQKIIVTSRKQKKIYKNYNFLNIQKKVIFEKLNPINKEQILKIIRKYNPDNIFYFAGQSSLTKSIKFKKETNISNYIGAKKFLEVMQKHNISAKFFKANSGYIFKPYKGIITINSKLSKNINPYIRSQIKAFKLIKKYRLYKMNLYSLIFLQVESPLRKNDFFIKKVCLHAKYKKKVTLGNINVTRDYSWAPEVMKAVWHASKLKPTDIILSSGNGMTGKDILKIAYNQNKLDYKKFYKIKNVFFRRNEEKILIGTKKNHHLLLKKYGFKFKVIGSKLVQKIYKSI